MVTALIFAGGTGQRMNSKSKPKQFLELHGKPVIIHTLEFFEQHEEVDQIVIACLEGWIGELHRQLEHYFISKVSAVVSGGGTGHESIYNGLKHMETSQKEGDIVLIHDGVRPLITQELITDNIKYVWKYGSCITVSPASESVIEVDSEGSIVKVPARSAMRIARAPQSFFYTDVWKAYQWARERELKTIDSSALMSMYGVKLHTLAGPPYNIKITGPSDYYVFRAIYEAIENQQIFGI